MTNRNELEYLGFLGFAPLGHLDASTVPQGPGVDVVCLPSRVNPVFLRESPAGRFKGKNPTVKICVLSNSWVEGTDLLYVGKAALGVSGNRGLRKRLIEYTRHGSGEPVGHRGGRYIWQLAKASELLVAWIETPNVDPALVESRMLTAFEAQFKRLPFANLRR